MTEVIITKNIEDKSILWFSKNNQYAIVEPIVTEIIQQLNSNYPHYLIVDHLTSTLDIPKNIAKDFIGDIQSTFLEKIKSELSERKDLIVTKPKEYSHIKEYQIGERIIQFYYQSEKELNFIHSKIAHLEIKNNNNSDVLFFIFSDQNMTFLFQNELNIGSWNENELHFFEGKVFMKLVEAVFEKPEPEWMGVFHASAVEKNNSTLLLFGDSGNGKSTSLALLHAHGFTCVADDFVPIDSEGFIRSFPAAISIKPGSLKVLSKYYPDLDDHKTHHLKRLNKFVKYIPNNNFNTKIKLPCKALIHIKYDANINLNIEQVSSLKTFESLLPDTWISPLENNVITFLEWFEKIPCYQLTYRNNQKMIEIIDKIFNDEL